MFNIKNFFNLNFYTSELDQFLTDFDKAKNKLSNAEQQEKNKYAKIHEKRDNPQSPVFKETFWENF